MALSGEMATAKSAHRRHRRRVGPSGRVSPSEQIPEPVSADHPPPPGRPALGGHSVANNIAAIPALIAAWLAETGSFTRGPGPMARASHGMDAAAQDTASRMLTTSTGAGVAARDIGAIARADPAGGIPAGAGITVGIQVMAPAISVWRRAGRLGPRAPPERLRAADPN